MSVEARVERVLSDAAVADLIGIAQAGLTETCDVYVMDDATGRYTTRYATGLACLLVRPTTMPDGRRAVGIKERVLLHHPDVTMPKDARVTLTAGMPTNVGGTWNVVGGTQWVRHLYEQPALAECVVELGRS